MRTPLLAGITLGIVGLIAASFWVARARSAPIPPVPGDLGAFDPGLAEVIRQAVDRVLEKPRSVDRRMQLGMVYEANELHGTAQDTYRQIAELRPGDARVWYRLAIVSDRLGLIDEAINTMQRAVAVDELYAPAHWRLGEWLLDAGRVGEAEAAFERAVRLAPEDPAGWYGLARVALQHNDAERAIEIIEGHLLEGPPAPRGYQLLGRAYNALGRTDDARKALARADADAVLWDDPWTGDVSSFQAGTIALRAIAGRHLRQGEYSIAIEILEMLLEEEPDDTRLLNQLGLAYAMTNRTAESQSTLQRSLGLGSENFQTHYYLADTISKNALATWVELERGLQHIDRAIELNRMSSLAHLTKAVLQFRLDRKVLAAREFKQAFELDARNLRPLLDAGFIELDLKRWGDALSTFELALDHDPQLADAHVGRAVALMELGRLDEADRTLHRARELDAGDQRRLSIAEDRLKALR